MSTSLPRFYAAEPTREREVAIYIDGNYVCRGPASEAVSPARYGTRCVPADRLAFELDRPWGNASDRPCLCWGTGRLSPAEFLAWYASVK